MSWHFTDDVERFANAAWALLAERPAENTLALTITESLLRGRRYSDEPELFGWFDEDGETQGAVLYNAPYRLELVVVPDNALAALAHEVRARRADLPGVGGAHEVARRFAELWTDGSQDWHIEIQQRLYSLTKLRPLEPRPDGSARVAAIADLDLLDDWSTGFQREVGISFGPKQRDWIRDRIETGLTWLWIRNDGTPVSQAGRNPTVANVARVGPVYTPPQHRGQGYGAAVTAACTQDALTRGAHRVVLFTDLSNPTSNAIYQKIGYRPVSDRAAIAFSSHRALAGRSAEPDR